MTTNTDSQFSTVFKIPEYADLHNYQQTTTIDHHATNNDLPPLPCDISDFSNCIDSDFSSPSYNLGQEAWSQSSSLMASDQTSSNGFDNILANTTMQNGSYFGFDSSEYVHSPLFSSMPPVSDAVPDCFHLGSSSYFF